MLKGAIFGFFLLLAYSSRAAVWNDHNQWSQAWEDKFSAWIASDYIQKEIFVSPKSPYYGVIADCADTAYVFRAIFSFENHLPFAVVNPSSVTDKKGRQLPRSQYRLFTNRSEKFNLIVDPQKRMIVFLNWLAETLGTWNIRSVDTYPIPLKSVRAGDIFHYEIDKNKSTVKHTYFIKEVENFGTLTVLYSTQAIKRNNMAYFKNDPRNKPSPRGIMIKKGYEINLKPDRLSGGYRRFRWPQHLLLDQKDLPKEIPVSMEQFKVAEKMKSGKQFFEYFRSLHASSQEVLEEEIMRKMNLVCGLASERVEIVKEGEEFRQKKRSRNLAASCFSYEEFDTYSTPMRDKEIKEAFGDLLIHYKHFQKKQVLLHEETARELQYIFSKYKMESFKSKICNLNINAEKSVDLRHVYRAVQSRRLASDPNQSVLARWGFERAVSKQCPTFYED